MQCSRLETHDEVLRSASPLDAPLLLLQICSRWRHVALATPRLWGELQIDLGPGPTEPYPRIQLLKYWLANANPHPISLAANATPLLHSSRQRICPNMANFVRTARRFRKLHLQVNPAALCALSRERARIDVEDLRIDLRHHLPYYFDSLPLQFHGSYRAFQDSELLRSFTMLSSAPARRSVLLKFILPWAQLTHLRIDERNLPLSAMGVFADCTNLVECTLGRLIDSDDDCLPHLTDAHFSFEPDADPFITDEFLKCLTLPSLKRLIIQSHDVDSNWAASAFTSFRLRSSFTLETLELHAKGKSMQTDEFIELLECVPSLKNLTAMIPGLNPAVVFRALTCADPRFTLLPVLERLSFGLVNSERSASLEPLIAMVRSRHKQERAEVPAALSRLVYLHLVSYERTPAIDRWWWELKLPKVFPELELRFEVCLPDVPCTSMASHS
ncbi:hypothetical protein B0H17DRAFT_1055504 [Mycena rosella]|uniref:F-box domain-containing protein n=1 Tax=Mycena rosella TaxID=1033263 RepID=A0AAD7DP00_MYCRO|nr:hypothetical protein B0H17DRAFT_1055504 [Mycena rosella]